jgi:hypothetical protein
MILLDERNWVKLLQTQCDAVKCIYFTQFSIRFFYSDGNSGLSRLVLVA